MLSPPLAEVSLSRSSSHLSFYLAADPSTATLRSTAHRSSTAYRGRDDHRILSLSLPLSLGYCGFVFCFFFLSLNGRSLLGFVLINFCCLFLFLKMLAGCSTKCLNRIMLGFVVVIIFCCLFLVLKDARQVFDKMSEPNCAWFCGCDNFLLSFFGSRRCSTGVRQNV
jgi:hypothetical protein